MWSRRENADDHSATPKAMYAERTRAPATEGRKTFVEADRHTACLYKAFYKVEANLDRTWWKQQSH